MAKENLPITHDEILHRCDLRTKRMLLLLGSGLAGAISLIGTGIIEDKPLCISTYIYTLIIFSAFFLLMSFQYLSWPASEIRQLSEEEFGNAHAQLKTIRLGEVFEDTSFMYQAVIALLFILTIWEHKIAMNIFMHNYFPYLFWPLVILCPVIFYLRSSPYSPANKESETFES